MADRHLCEVCGASFIQSQSLHRHEREKHGVGIMRAQCTICPKSYVRQAGLTKHLRTHDADLQLCQICGKTFKTLAAIAKHLTSHSTPAQPTSSSAPSTGPVPVPSTSSAPTSVNLSLGDCDFQSALNGCCSSYKFKVPDGETDLQSALVKLIVQMRALLAKHLKTTGLRWYLGARIQFAKANDPETKTVASFSTRSARTLGEFSLDDELGQLSIQLLNRVAQFQREGSDWTICTIITIDLNMVQYLPL